MQMEKSPSRRRKALQLGTVVGVAATAVIVSASPSWAAEDVATVNPVSATASTAVPVTLSVASQSAVANSFISGATFVEFQSAGTCAGTQTPSSPAPFATVSAANVTVISPTKLSFTTPTTLVAGTYSVCAYNGALGALLAKANAGFTTGTAPTILSWSPKAASTQGGGTLVVTGTGLGGTTASIGGAPIADWAPIGTTTATGTIPANGVGSFPLIVTKTGGGNATQVAAFSYGNGLTVTPNYASNSKVRTDVAIVGANLAGISFGTTTGATPDDTNGHVYLTKGNYDPSKNGLVKTAGQVTECLNVLPISNSELVCSLYLSGVGGVPVTPTRAVMGTVSGTTLTSATGAFGPGDVGQTVTGGTLGTNTYITAVVDPTKVTLNKAPTTAITTATSLTLNPQRTVTDLTFANASNSITSATGAQFSSADIGRVVVGTGLTNQTITAVTSPTTATLSANSTAASTGSYTITASKAILPAVPTGTYTLMVVNNGSVDAQNATGYATSVVNSGSTFTVADF
jgi:hypothetical protein